MRYYRHADADGLIARTDDGTFDLGTADEPVDEFRELAAAAQLSGVDLGGITEAVVETAEPVREPVPRELERPIRPDEVWAAGVTYEISEQAREEESTQPDIYDRVYDAERPELFLKATASRTVGPGDRVGIRADSSWDVPEPELGIVLYRGSIVGYTIGNDVSSRSLEGENPLYLTQAKVYDRCCSIGPGVTAAGSIADPHDLEIRMTITRRGETVYDASTSTRNMVRTCEELASYLRRHNAVPELAVLLTGTTLVPDESFTLAEDDSIEIEIDGIGRLENSVTVV